MAKEVLTKLSNDDLKHVCGGEIYEATEGGETRWYVPTLPTEEEIDTAKYFSTLEDALDYAFKKGLWLDITHCDTHRQAELAARTRGLHFRLTESKWIPSKFQREIWERQVAMYEEKLEPTYSYDW